MHMIADVNPGMLTQATVYTGTAFSSFSALAVFSERRSFLFLGGIIMTLLQGMMLYSLISWFGGAQIGLGYIMMGLFVTCMFVIFDTQLIIE